MLAHLAHLLQPSLLVGPLQSPELGLQLVAIDAQVVLHLLHLVVKMSQSGALVSVQLGLIPNLLLEGVRRQRPQPVVVGPLDGLGHLLRDAARLGVLRILEADEQEVQVEDG